MFTFVIDLFTIYCFFFKSLPWTYQFSKVTTVTLQTFLLRYARRYGGNGAGEGGGGSPGWAYWCWEHIIQYHKWIKWYNCELSLLPKGRCCILPDNYELWMKSKILNIYCIRKAIYSPCFFKSFFFTTILCIYLHVHINKKFALIECTCGIKMQCVLILSKQWL